MMGEGKVIFSMLAAAGGGHSIYYYAGMTSGFLCAFIVAAFLFWMKRKMKGGKAGFKGLRCSFDERQLLARGTAYKRAFFTLFFFIFGVSMLNELAGIDIFMSFGGMWIGVCISLIVFAITCIVHDAYMSLYENAKGIIMMFSSVGLLNILLGLEYLTGERPFLENGVIVTDSLNLTVGITFFIILIVFLVRLRYSKKQMDEDEE